MMEQFGDNLEEQIPKSERDNYEGEWVDAEKIMKEQVQDVTKSTASELAAFKESGIHDLLEGGNPDGGKDMLDDPTNPAPVEDRADPFNLIPEDSGSKIQAEGPYAPSEDASGDGSLKDQAAQPQKGGTGGIRGRHG